MNHLTYQIEYIKTSLFEMMELVKSQFEKSTKALVDYDLELAEEIIRRESRVNAFELNLDKECENSIALYQPVASELRLLISTIKAISELERIGDYADFIAKALVDIQNKPFSKKYIKSFKFLEMHQVVIKMFDNIITSFDDENANRARKVFKQDKDINKLFKSSLVNFHEAMKEDKANYEEILLLYAICARMERTGDLLTNLAEEVIFYLEAEVLKHKKLKVKIKPKNNEEL